jgi:Na+/phosphate symporter
MKLFSKGKKATIGMAIAGFCLLFVGIDILQDGMRFLSHYINLSGFTVISMLDELILVAVGIAMTVALQSSTVAGVTAITALNAGTINLEQSRCFYRSKHRKFYYGSSLQLERQILRARPHWCIFFSMWLPVS